MKKYQLTWEPRKSEIENARRNLPLIAAGFLKEGNNVVTEKVPVEDLHPFRLQAKRFRYTLELFQGCYGPGFEERLQTLRELQNHLGDINDCITTGRLLKKEGAGDGVKKVLKYLDRRAAKKASEFRAYWEEHFAAAEREQWWIDYLTRFAGHKQDSGH